MHETPPAEPIRKSLLPCTPPPEWEFSSAFPTGLADEPGLMLLPSDQGPVVVRRRVTYGDWEPVRPDRWAEEPEQDTQPAVPTPPADRNLRDRLDAVIDDVFTRWEHPGLGEQRPQDAIRAAVLRDFVWRLGQSAGDDAAEKFLDDNPELRRMADEAQQAAPHPPITNYVVETYDADEWLVSNARTDDLDSSRAKLRARRNKWPDMPLRIVRSVETYTIVEVDDPQVPGCAACEAGIAHDGHCPTPESHNAGCGCPTDTPAN